MANKQIKDFVEKAILDNSDQILIQESGGVTKKVLAINILPQEIRNQVYSSLSTGLISGGILSINSLDSSKYDIGAGKGYIVDTSDLDNITIIILEWNAITGITPTSTPTVVPYIGSNGASGELTSTSIKTNIDNNYNKILLGSIQPLTLGGIIVGLNNATMVVNQNLSKTVADLSFAMGIQRLNGLNFSANGTNLKIDVENGSIFWAGSNFKNDSTNPNVFDFTFTNPISFIPGYRDGSGSFILQTPTQDLSDGSPSNQKYWDDGSGTLQTYGGNDVGIYRLFLSTGGNFFMVYPQTVYNNLDDAKQSVLTESVELSEELETTLFIGYILVRGNTSDLSSSDNEFINASSNSGTLAAQTVNLQKSYNNSGNPQITVVDETDGSLTVKDSSTNANRDNIFEIKKDDDTIVFAVDRNGISVGSGTSSSGTYTPTLTNFTNVVSSSLNSAMFSRNGSIVTVTFSVDIEAGSTGTGSTILKLSVPVASSFTQSEDAQGNALSYNGGQGTITAYPDGTVGLQLTASDTSSRIYHGTFQYIIK